MTDHPTPEDDKLPETEANERFRKLVGNLVNTPHKPHVVKRERDKRKPNSASAPQ